MAARQHALGGVAASMAMLLLLSITVVAAGPAETRNWSEAIAAGRSSQTYHEAVMRAADKQLRSFKLDKRRAYRLLSRAKRDLERARERRSVLKTRSRSTMLSLVAARDLASVEAGASTDPASPPWSPPPAAGAALPDALVSPAEQMIAGQETGPDLATVRISDLEAALPVVPVTPPPSGILVERIDSLERQARIDERRLRKANRRLHRSERQRGARVRHIGSLQGTRRAALARRASAEAGLASAILSMSRLAERRAIKKTSVRPGRTYEFAQPAVGRITQGYGCTGFSLNPARGGCPHFHDGVDIAGYLGTPVRAAAVGVVSYVGWNPWDNRPRAFMVVIAHPGGLETLYAHVVPIRRVKVGQLVRRGELIAYMGSTGHATGVHLHLEIRRDERTVDPLAFL